jgi:hypothetical protein
VRAITTRPMGKGVTVPFWPSLLVAVAGTLLSTILLGLPSRLTGALVRLAIPRDMTMVVVGPCPSGWRQSDAMSGRLLIAADGNAVKSGTIGNLVVAPGGATAVTAVLGTSPPANRARLFSNTATPSASTALGYVAVNLCQLQ